MLHQELDRPQKTCDCNSEPIMSVDCVPSQAMDIDKKLFDMCSENVFIQPQIPGC